MSLLVGKVVRVRLEGCLRKVNGMGKVVRVVHGRRYWI